MRRAHPDHGGSDEEFTAVAEAWEVLSDQRRRESYDEILRLDDLLARAKSSSQTTQRERATARASGTESRPTTGWQTTAPASEARRSDPRPRPSATRLRTGRRISWGGLTGPGLVFVTGWVGWEGARIHWRAVPHLVAALDAHVAPTLSLGGMGVIALSSWMISYWAHTAGHRLGRYGRGAALVLCAFAGLYLEPLAWSAPGGLVALVGAFLALRRMAKGRVRQRA